MSLLNKNQCVDCGDELTDKEQLHYDTQNKHRYENLISKGQTEKAGMFAPRCYQDDMKLIAKVKAKAESV